MKKFLLGLAALVATAAPAAALPFGIFDHLGVGVGVGTTGITIEAATPITRFVQMRAGVSIMPGITFGVDTDIDYEVSGISRSADIRVDGSLKRVQGEVIFNVYPIPVASFYVAAGAYFGGNTLVGIKGHSDAIAQEIAAGHVVSGNVQIGDYTIPVDDNGDVKGGLRVNGFRPYLGIGWGRPVPGKLLNFQVELGVQFHGKPEVYTDYGTVGLPAMDDDDTFQKIMDKVKVYPNLMFRINFRAL